MSVYVDLMCAHGWCLRGRWVDSCHMFADTVEELFLFGDKIGLKRKWVQGVDEKGREPHFDLVLSKRVVAVAAGAIELTREEAVAIWRKHRESNIGEKEGKT